ncbi:class I SAM-dependent methyltransferase [Arthrobacter sp. ISL-48]|uniref:class I SAM-dependent methyltransferase n=1 Tax=Arthrobacter sp. ISL-48 TaxID=2819110 RepID=UPI001BE606F3|nr:class I SAM-dependent methyltransferase [Arthrobacter sp. ISL-48]MBT2534075.1 class I SAM-dependent methyltransferase [Arthrobacter sp. ISL-48]
MLPKLIRLSRLAPKDRQVAWERYWAGITTTGPLGEVLWDSGNDHELLGYREALQRHLDPGLPVVDIGCGHGSYTRGLAAFFPQALGVDVSEHAVERARSESADTENVSYLVRDMTAPGAGHGLAGSTDANVFIRGVLHVLEPADQAAVVNNLRDIVGTRGTVFLAETNFQGTPLEYVTHLGATPRDIPAPLERAIRELPMPGHFGPLELSRVMPPEAWELLEDGPATIETNPMTGVAGASLIPGYFAVLRARS